MFKIPLAIFIIAVVYFLMQLIFFSIFNKAFGIKDRKNKLLFLDYFYSLITLMIWMLTYYAVYSLSINGIFNLNNFDLTSYKFLTFLLFLFLTTDFMEYIIHYAYHTIPILKEIHKVHHTPSELNWSRALRLSIFESFTTSMIINLFLAFMIGGETIIYTTIFFELKRIYGFYLHSNTDMTNSKISKYLASPRYHHWHHALNFQTPFNLCTLCPIWDILFKTYYGEGSTMPKSYGLASESKPYISENNLAKDI